MPDVSFSPIGDAAAVAALLWAVWYELQKKNPFRPIPGLGGRSSAGPLAAK
jgi:hypothetical protein